MKSQRAKMWREIAARIEKEQDCGPFGLCYYLDTRCLYNAAHWLNMNEQLSAHARDNMRKLSTVACASAAVFCEPSAYLDEKGVWETRVLLAYFLAHEAEDEAEDRG